MISWIKKIKDPISCMTHMIGAILSVGGLIWLLIAASKKGSIWHWIGFSVFGVSLILLYTASTVYHMFDRSEKTNRLLQKIDHMMIFVLIAGTYTPICLTILRDRGGLWMLLLIWTIGIGGMILKGFRMNLPRWISTGLYLMMGWIVIIAIYPLFRLMPLGGFLWMCTGGVLYTIGAMIYGFQRPRLPWKHFGSHEVFHLFVMAGSFSHFMMMPYAI